MRLYEKTDPHQLRVRFSFPKNNTLRSPARNRGAFTQIIFISSPLDKYERFSAKIDFDDVALRLV